jgi:ATP synthase protein I
MSDDKQPPSLTELDEELRKARARHDAEQGGSRPGLPAERGASAGYRVSVELFAGMLFGGGVGWFLDRWLGTRPWLLVGMFLLGSAAGLMNAYRAIKRAERESSGPVIAKGKPGAEME